MNAFIYNERFAKKWIRDDLKNNTVLMYQIRPLTEEI